MTISFHLACSQKPQKVRIRGRSFSLIHLSSLGALCYNGAKFWGQVAPSRRSLVQTFNKSPSASNLPVTQSLPREASSTYREPQLTSTTLSSTTCHKINAPGQRPTLSRQILALLRSLDIIVSTPRVFSSSPFMTRTKEAGARVTFIEQE